jgi:ferredoxin-fold anticodon binding domain-containing protein
VDVCLRVGRDVVVDNDVNVGNVEAARGHVGCNLNGEKAIVARPGPNPTGTTLKFRITNVRTLHF